MAPATSPGLRPAAGLPARLTSSLKRIRNAILAGPSMAPATSPGLRPAAGLPARLTGQRRVCMLAAAIGLLAGDLGAAASPATREVPPAPHTMPNAEAVALSADGSLVAAGIGGGLGRDRERAGRIHVWERQTGRLVRSVPALGDIVGLAFTHDGRGIVWASIYTPGDSVDADSIRGIAINTGEPLGRGFNRRSFALSPTEAALLAADGEGIAGRYDPVDRDSRRGRVTLPNAGAGRQLAYAPDGRSFAAVHLVGDPIIRPDGSTAGLRLMLEGLLIGDSETLLPRRWIRSATLRTCTALAVSRTGRRVATGHEDGTIRVWEGDTLELVASWEGSGDETAARPVFSPVDDSLAVISQPTVSRIWRRDNATPGGFTFETKASGDDCRVVLHDPESLEPIRRFTLRDARFRVIHANRPAVAFNPPRLTFSPDGDHLLVGASGLTLIDRKTGEVIRRFDSD